MKLLKKETLFLHGANLSIRGATIGLKFLFTLFLGKYFPDELLGEYGLFTTTILLSYFVLSFSFDSYALREIVHKPKTEHMRFFKNTIVFYVASFSFFLPLSVIFIFYDWVRLDLLLYFLVILLLEVLCQSFFSLFLIIQRSIRANLVMFFSQGAWMPIIFLLWIINPEGIGSLKDLLFAWILGNLAACFYAYFSLSNIYGPIRLNGPIDWQWIWTGLSVSLIFFVSTLSYKFIEFSDRYLIEFQIGTAKLGIYVFYAQLANLLNALINVLVILIQYPRLIDHFANGRIDAFLLVRNKMYFQVIVLGAGAFLVLSFLLKYVLLFLGKESFSSEASTFYVLLLSNVILNISFIPHYCLYAFRKDMTLLYTTLAGAAINLTMNLILIPIYGILGAAIATLTSFVFVWLSKSYYLSINIRHLRNES